MKKESTLNLENISTPINTLIEKISNCIGILYEPKRIVRNARAEAEANKIKAINKLEISQIEEKALLRLAKEEAIKQKNIDSIISKSIYEIRENANPENIDVDWLQYFFNKCRIVSNDDMQTLWAHILAGEANQPGSFSKTTLKVVDEMEKDDAVNFTNLCSFVFNIEEPTLVVFDHNLDFYKQKGVTFTNINRLERLGLLSLNFNPKYETVELNDSYSFSYFGKPIEVQFNSKKSNTLFLGIACLSNVGTELFKICNAKSDIEIMNFSINEWDKDDNVKCILTN